MAPLELAQRPDPRTWREDYLFSIAIRSWLVHLGVVILTYAILVTERQPSWLNAWLALMLAGSAYLGLLSLRYPNRQEPAPERARQFSALHSIVIAGVGLCWGLGAVGVALDLPDRLGLYAIVVGGTALGAVSSQHALLRSCLLAVWMSLPGLALAFVLYAPDLRGAAMGLMILLYGAMLTTLARRMHRFLASNVALLAVLEEKVVALEAAQRDADQANAAKSRLLAQASHDLRQPVHAIGLLVESLRHDETDAERQEIIRRIDHALGGLGRLFQSLLDVATLDLGRIKPAPAPVMLMPLLEDAARQVEELARENAVAIRLVRTSLCVQADADLLQTMLQNLLSNAVKYAPGGSVLVGCRRRRGGACIEIHDNGLGIPAEFHEKIFEEFFRLQPGGRGKIEGLGLGLSIVRRLATLMDIEVSVISQPDRGALFRLAGLPLAKKAAAMAPARPPEPRNPLEGFSVMVVDDDAAVREGMAALLQRWGCRVDARSVPPDEPAEFDLLIIDQMLGGEATGIEAVERLAEAGRAFSAAIITGAIVPELEDRAKALGVPVLMKPVRPGQLHSLLLTADGRRRHRARPALAAEA